MFHDFYDLWHDNDSLDNFLLESIDRLEAFCDDFALDWCDDGWYLDRYLLSGDGRDDVGADISDFFDELDFFFLIDFN